MWNIILWLFVVGLWWVGIYFSPNLTSVFGRNAWAERNLWWTRNAVILFGFVVIILWIMMMFGMLDGMQDATTTWMWGLW